MDNFGQTNNTQNFFSSELEHATSKNNQKPHSSSENSQIPVSLNSNEAGNQIQAVPNPNPLHSNQTQPPPYITPASPIPTQLPGFEVGNDNSNLDDPFADIPDIPDSPNTYFSTFQSNTPFNDTQVPRNITPQSPNPNPLPGLKVGNADSNLDNLIPNNPHQALPASPKTLFNIGSSVPNEANARNVARRTRPGRPLGSRNKPKVHAYPSQDLSTSVIVLQIPPNTEIISWLLNYAQHRDMSLSVLSGFGSISKAIIKPVGFQALPREYSDRVMAMMSISGLYVYSPAQPSPSTSYFYAEVARENQQVIGGGALKIVTAGHAVLQISLYPRSPYL